MTRKLLFAAVSLALSAGVNAAPLTSTQSAGFSVATSTVTDTTPRTSSAATQADSFSYPAMTFSKFQASTGVLTGVSSSLFISGGSVTLSASGTPTGTGTPQFHSVGDVYVRSYITGTNSNHLPGQSLNERLTNQCNASTPCFPSGVTNLSENSSMTKTDSTWLSPTGVAPSTAANLNLYVGSGPLATTVAVQNSLILETATSPTSVIANRTARQTITGLTGTLSLNYSYLRHANASFSSGANIDERTIAAGSGFSVFNFGDASSTNLDSVSRVCISGDCAAFNVTLASFQNLAGGGSVAGTTALTASAKSNSAATYLLTYKDDNALGVAGTQMQNTLLLNVAAVPEPAEWTMLIAGLLVVGFIARRRRQNFA